MSSDSKKRTRSTANDVPPVAPRTVDLPAYLRCPGQASTTGHLCNNELTQSFVEAFNRDRGFATCTLGIGQEAGGTPDSRYRKRLKSAISAVVSEGAAVSAIDLPVGRAPCVHAFVPGANRAEYHACVFSAINARNRASFRAKSYTAGQQLLVVARSADRKNIDNIYLLPRRPYGAVQPCKSSAWRSLVTFALDGSFDGTGDISGNAKAKTSSSSVSSTDIIGGKSDVSERDTMEPTTAEKKQHFLLAALPRALDESARLDGAKSHPLQGHPLIVAPPATAFAPYMTPYDNKNPRAYENHTLKITVRLTKSEIEFVEAEEQNIGVDCLLRLRSRAPGADCATVEIKGSKTLYGKGRYQFVFTKVGLRGTLALNGLLLLQTMDTGHLYHITPSDFQSIAQLLTFSPPLMHTHLQLDIMDEFWRARMLPDSQALCDALMRHARAYAHLSQGYVHEQLSPAAGVERQAYAVFEAPLAALGVRFVRQGVQTANGKCDMRLEFDGLAVNTEWKVVTAVKNGRNGGHANCRGYVTDAHGVDFFIVPFREHTESSRSSTSSSGSVGSDTLRFTGVFVTSITAVRARVPACGIGYWNKTTHAREYVSLDAPDACSRVITLLFGPRTRSSSSSIPAPLAVGQPHSIDAQCRGDDNLPLRRDAADHVDKKQRLDPAAVSPAQTT